VKFVYDGWNLLAELNATNNNIARSYLWGNDLSGTIQGAGGVGGLLFIRDVPSAIGYCAPAFDGNGNVAALVSMSGGTNCATYEYGPFGEVLRATGPMAKANPFRFSTKYQDDETDLLYYGYRYYNASTGSWISRDPIEEIGFRTSSSPQRKSRFDLVLPTRADPNLAAMVNNNPVNKCDFRGLRSAGGGDYHSHCCPELAYWTPCSEICKMALLNFEINHTFMVHHGGGVACYHGKACGCMVPDNDTGFYPGECPEIDAIVQAHEDAHVPNIKCHKCGFYAATSEDLQVDYKKEECEKGKKSLSDFQAIKGTLSGKCATVADHFITLLQRATKDCP
jgi:RHS repeat-associated protein